MKDLNSTERKIITALTDAALAKGWLISVSDGEEWTVSRSTDRKAIRAAIGTTDETTLKFWTRGLTNGPAIRLGLIWLVHGNAEDVISDSTDNADMQTLCAIGTQAAA